MSVEPDEAVPVAEPVPPFRVLFVCTANMCRSPLAEHLFRWELARRDAATGQGRWDVRSAGTHAALGTRTHPLVVEVLAERGIETDPAPARPLTAALAEGSDLILTTTRHQRAEVVGLAPTTLRRTFTVRQFARWCEAARGAGDGRPVVGGESLLSVASAGQTRVQPVAAREDDIADPIGLGIEAFRSCRNLTAAAVAAMLRPPAEP